MSTFNGERYLKEQLDSIFRQTHRNLELLVRDDGSTDNTMSILDEYANIHPNMKYYKGENLKPARSFLDLLHRAPDSNYYAFADQDDVWLPEKIAAAIGLLQNNMADFYYSQTTPVDSELNILSYKSLVPMSTLGSSLVYASVTGCTVVFSRRLLEIVISYYPDFIMMHDAWIYKIALSTGCRVVFDNNSCVLYRQHNNNAVGANRGWKKKCLERLHTFISPTCARSKEAEELYKGFSDKMAMIEKVIVKRIADYKSFSLWDRMKIALSSDYHCGQVIYDCIFFFAIITKRF